MKLIEGVELSKLCDYSFGDQSGKFSNVYTHFMKSANLLNLEFVDKVLKSDKNYLTLFIDNIRLYKRNIENLKPEDKSYVESLMGDSDLLELCSKFPDKKFIIFTNLEDTPIDDFIFNRIPDNVLSVNAVNAISFGGKVNPIPYGVQRRFTPNDNRIEILLSFMNMNDNNNFKNLLYVNHSVNTNPKERVGIKEIFADKSWARVERESVDYQTYLTHLKNSKFMICPIGNAIDCHRNWEVIYMRRVPIMKRHPYLEELFKEYPILFVDDYAEVTEELLEKNQGLFNLMQTICVENIDLNNFYNKIVCDSLKER